MITSRILAAPGSGDFVVFSELTSMKGFNLFADALDTTKYDSFCNVMYDTLNYIVHVYHKSYLPSESWWDGVHASATGTDAKIDTDAAATNLFPTDRLAVPLEHSRQLHGQFIQE